MLISVAFVTADDVIANAERVRRRAREIAERYPQYAELVGLPSGWCVVTENGWWPYAFHNMVDEDLLRERINRGRKVIVTVGLVAVPGTALSGTDHVAVVSRTEPEWLSPKRLEWVVGRAKRCATSAMYG